MIKDLITLANNLDAKGLVQEVNRLDKIIERISAFNFDDLVGSPNPPVTSIGDLDFNPIDTATEEALSLDLPDGIDDEERKVLDDLERLLMNRDPSDNRYDAEGDLSDAEKEVNSQLYMMGLDELESLSDEINEAVEMVEDARYSSSEISNYSKLLSMVTKEIDMRKSRDGEDYD